MDGKEILALYENVAVLTGHMLDAAREGDWDRLGQLEAVCSRQVQILQCNDAPVRMAGPDRERKVELITRILADDREIRLIAEPWMGRLSALINSAGTERKLSQAYGKTEEF